MAGIVRGRVLHLAQIIVVIVVDGVFAIWIVKKAGGLRSGILKGDDVVEIGPKVFIAVIDIDILVGLAPLDFKIFAFGSFMQAAVV